MNAWKAVAVIAIVSLSLTACNSKQYSSSLFAPAKNKAANEFLYETPLTKLSATEDFAPLVTNAERLEYCSPNLISSNAAALAAADKLLGENLFEMALKAPTPELYEKILEAAFSQLGKRYSSGGKTPRQGFDCSGFTTWVFNRYGIELPRSSREQYQVGKMVAKNQLRKGDLVFFKTRKSRISHVGIYLENGKFIHSASAGKDVQISSLDETYWSKRYAGGRRVLR